MATQRLVIDGYGQVELNNVAFRRNGRIEAQCAPDPTDFENIPVENGMILAVDAANRVVKLPVDDSLPLALVYSAEHMYDERTPGLKSFKLMVRMIFILALVILQSVISGIQIQFAMMILNLLQKQSF